MERFIVGDIVVVQFSFTDLSSIIKRPALVLATIEGNGIILCEITSKMRNDSYVAYLENEDLESRFLKIKSIIRPNRLITLDKNKIKYKYAGHFVLYSGRIN